MAHLKEGDMAPHFTGKDQNGNVISLDKMKGKKVILYFYPKDNTPGCTAEACNLRDHHSGLTVKGFEVIGVGEKIDEVFYIFEFSDNEGELETALEHGDIFENLRYERFSHH